MMEITLHRANLEYLPVTAELRQHLKKVDLEYYTLSYFFLL